MKIKIQYINGIRFRRFIITSAQRIEQTRHHLNQINVFPVADGDTGTNLATTMNNIVQGIQDFKKNSFEEMIQKIAKSALMGARGNSGAILAQFFQGLADATKGMSKLSTVAFSKAAVKAVEQATLAIACPKEGTIITVMREWAQFLSLFSRKTPDFVELFKNSLEKAKKSLMETPEKLAMLKEAGVVDAGAEGFVNLLEGIVEFIDYGKLKSLNKEDHDLSFQLKEKPIFPPKERGKFRFCTECLIEGISMDKKMIQKAFAELGDSQVVAGSNEQIRLHIHTNQPELVFETAGMIGCVSERKIDDMWEQANRTNKPIIALVADTTCDLPEEFVQKYQIHLIPIAVQVDRKSYLDRIDINTEKVIQYLEDPGCQVTTSQPPYQFFDDAYQKACQKFEKVISVHISGRLSGTYQAACVASQKQKRNRIYVIDSKTGSVALGLIVLKIARMIEEGIDIDEIVQKTKKYIENSKIFVSIPSLKYLIKSGRLGRIKGMIGTMIHLKPVITLNRQGEFVEAVKVIGHQNLLTKTMELASQFADKLKNPCFAIAHVQDLSLAQWYEKELKTRFPQAEIFISEGSPALSVHIGKGGAAIAVMES